MSDKNIGYQVMESVEADFEAMTWTFRLQSSNRVAAGNYAITPVEPFMVMQSKLTEAEGLLRWLGEKHEALTDHEREKIYRFFDPAP